MAIVKAAIPRIILMLNPVGAIAQIILAIYNAIVWFVNNIDRIINWVKAVFDSVVSIAKGAIDVAATKVEESMARAIPIILAFLAQQLNLGNVAEGITKAIKKIREPIDKLVNKVVDWIAAKAKKLLDKLFKKKPGAANRPEDKRTPQEKQQALNKGVKEGTDYVKAGGKTRKHVDKKLKELEDTYQLTDLYLVVDKDNETGADLVHVHGEVNPEKDGDKVETNFEDNSLDEELKPVTFNMSDAHHELLSKDGKVLMTPKKQNGLVNKIETTIKNITSDKENVKYKGQANKIIETLEEAKLETLNLESNYKKASPEERKRIYQPILENISNTLREIGQLYEITDLAMHYAKPPESEEELKLKKDIVKRLGNELFKLGKYAEPSTIKATKRKADDKEKAQIQIVGNRIGCHISQFSIQKSNKDLPWVADHQPPTFLKDYAEKSDELKTLILQAGIKVEEPAMLYPMSDQLSHQQGGFSGVLSTKMDNYIKLKAEIKAKNQ